jgi:carbon-monoxide dehydrogenase medium subunit
MIPAAFDYVRADSVEDALRLLAEHGDDAKLLAGGHSLIPMMKLRFATPGMLIDINGIPGLAGITESGDRLAIGALTTHAALAADDRLRTLAPVLWDAANHVGDPQVRNRGTIGGSAAHADPAADYPAVLLALDAAFAITGRTGKHTVAAGDFFTGMFETALGGGDVLTSIAFNAAPHSAYAKFPHPASHYAVVGVAAVLQLRDGAIASARIAVSGVSDRAYRAASVERALAGVKVSDGAAIEKACAGAAAGIEARHDTFASSAYRSAMADVFAARAVAAAAVR